MNIEEVIIIGILSVIAYVSRTFNSLRRIESMFGAGDHQGFLPRNFYDDEKQIEEFRPFMRKLEFLTPVCKGWKCAFCKVLLLRAWRAPCSHCFCGDCVQEMLLLNKECPVDKLLTTAQFHRAEDVETAVSLTYVFCPAGCESAFPAYEIAKHYRRCPFAQCAAAETINNRTHNQKQESDSTRDDFSRLLDKDNFQKEEHSSVPKHVYDQDIKKLEDKIAKQEIELLKYKRMFEEVKALQEYSEDANKKANDDAKKDGNNVCLKDRELIISATESSGQNIDCCSSNDAKDIKLLVDDPALQVIKDYGWTIYNVRQMTFLSNNGVDAVHKSEELYIDNTGLKVQCELHWNGLGDAKGKYVSMVVKTLVIPNMDTGDVGLIKKKVEVELISPVFPKKKISQEGVLNCNTLELSNEDCIFPQFLKRKLLNYAVSCQDYIMIKVSFKDACDSHHKGKSGWMRFRSD